MRTTGRDKIKKIKPLITLLVKINSVFPYFINYRLFVFFRNTSGYLGLLIRYILFKNLSIKCGENISIHEGVYLKGINNISVGNNISIHSMCYIDGSGGITIGNDVSVAHNSTIMTTNHTWNDIEIPIKYNKTTKGPVNIDNDVWIGCGCRILSGVNIKTRSIVAAGAVVNKDIEANSLFGGVPAKLIKKI